MTSRARRLAVAGAAAGMVLALTACEGGASGAGGTGQGAEDGALFAESVRLFRDAPSVRVTAPSAVALGSRVAIFVDRDKNCRVDAQNGFFRVVVERGGRTWVRWSEDYLQRDAHTPDGERLEKALSGKWLELGQEGRIRKSMVDLCALTPLRSVADELVKPGRRAVREPETTENGERLLPLRWGEEPSTVTAYVKPGAKPGDKAYPRKLAVDIVGFSLTPVDFLLDGYGEPVAAQPPAAALTVRSASIEALAEKHLAVGLHGSP
ncbi:hypothetical protein ACIPW5_05505 [Streptomyces sp. NPDC090077]|uniref:hypothetical protein n=1 Tax=Streptomyces sp. NPDC090077 TaxID=3365938 RepID=UPI003821FAF9